MSIIGINQSERDKNGCKCEKTKISEVMFKLKFVFHAFKYSSTQHTCTSITAINSTNSVNIEAKQDKANLSEQARKWTNFSVTHTPERQQKTSH